MKIALAQVNTTVGDLPYGTAGNGGAFTFTVENVSGQDGVLFRHNGGNMFYPGIMMNEWNHTAMRVSPGTTITNELEFFINGENVPGARNAGEDRPLVTNDTAFWVGTWLGPATPFTGTLDDAYFFDHALTDAEIRAVMNGTPPGQASQPDPDDEATDVARDSLLNWQAGEFAAQHDVYFGTRFDDVNDATPGARGTMSLLTLNPTRDRKVVAEDSAAAITPVSNIAPITGGIIFFAAQIMVSS